MGGVVSACFGIFYAVRSIVKTFKEIIIKIVEPPTEVIVRKAETIIQKANAPELMGKYITASTESKQLNNLSKDYADKLDKNDKANADNFLNSCQ